MVLRATYSPPLSAHSRVVQKPPPQSDNAEDQSAILNFIDSNDKEGILSFISAIINDKNRLTSFVNAVKISKNAPLFFHSLFSPASDGLSFAFWFLL
jgi:hypothetical protein